MDLPSQDMVTNITGTVEGSVFLWRDVGRQAIIDTIRIKYNSKHFQFKHDVCVYKVQAIIFQRIVWGKR